MIETVEVTVRRFDAIDERFARDYGEGERTLEFWNTMMWRYYAQQCANLRVAPTRDMPLVCEYFRLVYPDRERAVH